MRTWIPNSISFMYSLIVFLSLSLSLFACVYVSLFFSSSASSLLLSIHWSSCMTKSDHFPKWTLLHKKKKDRKGESASFFTLVSPFYLILHALSNGILPSFLARLLQFFVTLSHCCSLSSFVAFLHCGWGE